MSVAQSCPTVCDPINCSLPGSSVHGILEARILEGKKKKKRILEWVPNPGIEPGSPTLQAESLLSEPPGKPHVLITLVQTTFNQNGRVYSSGTAFTKPRNNNLFGLFFLCIFQQPHIHEGKPFSLVGYSTPTAQG